MNIHFGCVHTGQYVGPMTSGQLWIQTGESVRFHKWINVSIYGKKLVLDHVFHKLLS